MTEKRITKKFTKEELETLRKAFELLEKSNSFFRTDEYDCNLILKDDFEYILESGESL